MLKRVATTSEEKLRGLLSHLQAEEFIYEQPAFPELEYTFKHALTQEVAYSSLLIERRRVLHERTAQGIEEVFGNRLEDHYSELAHHYSHSGNAEKAIQYLQMAGQQAGQRSAYTEAISHLTTALELLLTLPDTPERARQELALQIALGTSLVITKGYGVPEVAKVYTRARELYQQVESTTQFLPVLFALWRFYFVRGAYQTARELAEQFTRLAHSEQDPMILLPAHLVPGLTLFRLGEFASARAHLEEGIALYDAEKHQVDRASTFFYSQDAGTMCLSYLAWTLGHLGYLDQALKRGQEALTLAHELAHPFSLSFALQFTASVHRFRGEGRAAQERAEAAITPARAQGFPYWVAGGTFVLGWALIEQGQREEGIAQMRQCFHKAIDIARRQGAKSLELWAVMSLSRLWQQQGKKEEARQTLAEIYDWFIEGFDTKDLQEAKALLEELR